MVSWRFCFHNNAEDPHYLDLVPNVPSNVPNGEIKPGVLIIAEPEAAVAAPVERVLVVRPSDEPWRRLEVSPIEEP